MYYRLKNLQKKKLKLFIFFQERMKSAAAIVAALSRPASQKSGAWSKDDDPEAGKRVEDSAKSRNSTKKPSTLEDILEEELAADEYKGQEHVGCWTRITSTLGSTYMITCLILAKDLKNISNLYYILTGIWSTSDLLSGEETEERVRTVTRELAIYCIFMGVLVWGMFPIIYLHTFLLFVRKKPFVYMLYFSNYQCYASHYVFIYLNVKEIV